MRPILIAHRGDPRHAPENTLESFRSAIAKGARAIEMDVRRTSDGTWVAFHDATLKRTAGRAGVVSQSRWGSLRALGVPSVAEVLKLCREKKVEAFLDVKVNSRQKELLQVIRRSGWGSRVSVGAGTPEALKRWKRLLTETSPFWVTGYRMRVSARRLALAKRLKLTGLVAYKGWVTRSVIQKVHRVGLKLFVWTIRAKSELKRFSRLGVDGIMSEVWPPPLHSDRSGRRSAKGRPATASRVLGWRGSG